MKKRNVRTMNNVVQLTMGNSKQNVPDIPTKCGHITAFEVKTKYTLCGSNRVGLVISGGSVFSVISNIEHFKCDFCPLCGEALNVK